MHVQFPLLIICFLRYSSSQRNTLNKACSAGDTKCDNGQVCINNRCECDPAQRRFWAGDKLQCRICPSHYSRLPNRCYKYYSTSKNQSAARADCRKDQADLYSWRDNTDENELITALLIAQTKNQINVNEQEYAWSSGIVHHGSDIDYAVTWLDPKAPTLQHPNMKNTANIGFCNQMTVFGYDGYTEPTQIIRADETEDCISFVFVPQTNSRGQVCLADDYCSTEMNYICEFTEASITGESFVPTSRSPPVESSSTDVIIPDEDTPSPLALTDSLNMSNVLIYGVILIVIFLIFGIVSYIIIRKRKQKADNPFATSQQNSTNNSIMSETESSENP